MVVCAQKTISRCHPLSLNSQVLWFTLLMNNKGADITKLLPRIVVDKIDWDFFIKGHVILLPLCDRRSIIAVINIDSFNRTCGKDRYTNYGISYIN
jgi:hypothetical protein